MSGYTRIRLKRGFVTWIAYLTDDPESMCAHGPFYAWTRDGAIKKARRANERKQRQPEYVAIDSRSK